MRRLTPIEKLALEADEAARDVRGKLDRMSDDDLYELVGRIFHQTRSRRRKGNKQAAGSGN